ncbi:uncharacterized protein LOC132280211 isoform X2 [Cornus florida]|uniref:uncharacterized protein LOC132280211 isoform X2 n=1 Tax=Cornus florida TaxID=4283 RepID=UPI00289DE648|nr:uncharacterized protein LOC132280211 isoform X2 [Cornus florida]
MASRDLITSYSKLLSRMAVRSLRTFAYSDSNSESYIPTNNSDSDSCSKQLPHAEGKKNRAFNRFLKEGPAYPCKDDDQHLINPQMMMRNTCDSRQWFISLEPDAVRDVVSNTFFTNEAGDAINGEGPASRLTLGVGTKFSERQKRF